MKTTFKTLAVAVALIAAATGCRSITGRTMGENMDDKTMAGTVKTKLVRDRLQNLTWVNVDARHGVVYLTGNVDTAAQKARATELATETRGVQRVVNDLVVNSGRADTASASTRSSSSTHARSSTTAPPAASPAVTSSRAASGTIAGEVVSVHQATGDVMLRMAGGNDVELRLPPASVQNVKVGDRLSVSVNAVAR